MTSPTEAPRTAATAALIRAHARCHGSTCTGTDDDAVCRPHADGAGWNHREATAPASPDVVEALRLPWHRETVGHLSTAGIVRQVAADLDVPLAEGLPPNTDATWIVNADNKIVAFVGNGPRQTHNADAIIRAVEAAATPQVQADPPAEGLLRAIDGMKAPAGLVPATEWISLPVLRRLIRDAATPAAKPEAE